MNEKKCLNCDSDLTKKNSKYCNNKCQSDYQHRLWVIQWRNGQKSGVSGIGIAKALRRFMFEKYNSKCARCDWSEINTFTNKIPLEVEHIDGNYLNNDESNLTLLCPNCHSLTATYKGANAGKGRPGR